MASARLKTPRPRKGDTFPTSISPMLATLIQDIPDNLGDWSTEFKWDGVRAITYFDGTSLDIRSRNDLPIAHRYPELAGLAKDLKHRPAILDGEIIALDEAGRPSFPLLQRRMHVQDTKAITRLRTSVPVTYMIFDLLYLDDRSAMDESFLQRRELLTSLHLKSESWDVSPAQTNEADSMLKIATERELEGIVLKRNNSIYEAGRRARTWLKYKLISRQEFVIGGWVPETVTNRRPRGGPDDRLLRAEVARPEIRRLGWNGL